MVVNWLEIGLQVGLNGLLFAILLAVSGVVAVRFFRPRVQQWIGGAIGNFMRQLATNAAEEEGTDGSSPQGALNIGGFKIDTDTIKAIAELAKLAKEYGFIKTGGGSGLLP